MKWSKYNFLFRSKKYGGLLYNSASNSFLQFDDATYTEVEKIRDDLDSYSFSDRPGLNIQLRMSNIIVEDRFDEEYRNRLKMSRLNNNYDSSHLMLTIAPTMGCNFACNYCFETDFSAVQMSDETEEQVINFIKRHPATKYISMTWFGGEPLLCFNRIVSMTEKIKEFDKKYTAMLISNGYLLDEKIIPKLKDLSITTIQITIDGLEETHDKRRPLKSTGSGTYARIMENTEKLLQGWDGKLDIRVNTDNSNKDVYHIAHDALLEKFEKYGRKRLRIYPGIVHDNDQINPDVSCFRDRFEEAVFNIRQYEEHGIEDLSFFPRTIVSGCIAARNNGYVIGPKGELYKCWDDLGIKEKVVGSVYSGKEWNMNLIGNYMVGASYHDDPECKECFLLPVCDGGCLYVRMQNYTENACKNVCSKFKDNLEDMLEIYYEIKKKYEEKKDEEPEVSNKEQESVVST